MTAGAGRRAVTLLVASLALAANASFVSSAAAAVPTDAFISEYVEGSSNNKAIEIYNGTGAAIDLTAGSYALVQYANGSPIPTASTALTGAIAPGDVFVLAHTGAAAAILSVADQTTAALTFNGNDAILLKKGQSTTLDWIGQAGVDPGPLGWGTDPADTVDNTLRRRSDISAGDINPEDSFDPAFEYDSFGLDAFGGLGTHGGGGGGGNDSGTVAADVTVPTSAACIELSTTSVSFGTQRFGGENLQASPGITVTNCSGTDEALLARGTDATGTGAAWNLVDDAATCGAGTLATDAFHLKLNRPADEVDPVTQLSTDNKQIAEMAGGDTTALEALLDMPCPGSSGAGQTMGMQIVFVVTEIQ